MSDSVDRVFSHALNTVNKIRTGSQKPPSATRLQLYGLYKQAMEGDVDGIMQRPEGHSEQDQRAREKWDAWKQQKGLSRTEAKRRYITTLIDTMHKYASPSPDSRELVAELEFVWDQVKSNVPSSTSSSPMQTLGHLDMHVSQGYSQISGSGGGGKQPTEPENACNDSGDGSDSQPLQIKSPVSQSAEDVQEEAEADLDEFVDAPDSQQDPMPTTSEHAAVSTRRERLPPDTPSSIQRMRSIVPEPLPISNPPSRPIPRGTHDPQPESIADRKWRARVEQALQKMNAEIAALREQLEARRLFAHSPHYRLFRGIWRCVQAMIKHVVVDLFILGIVLLYMRRKKDTRLERAMRVLLGDAAAQVQKVGGASLEKVKLLSLKVKKS